MDALPHATQAPTPLVHAGGFVSAFVSGGAWGYGTARLIVDLENMTTWDLEPPEAFANGAMLVGFVVAMVLAGVLGYAVAWMNRWSIGRSLLAVEGGLAVMSLLALLVAVGS